MRKKIALASSLLLATLANAEIGQSGFFVGLDISQVDSELKYDNSDSTAYAYNPYTNNISDNRVSFKAGYQAYFARIYARYSTFDYTDEKRDKFTIKGKVYELNADYIPLFYKSENKTWDIRGVFGFGVGYNSSTISDYDTSLLPSGVSGGSKQNYMEYGYQVGLMSETSIGLSIEAGYRARYGDLQEFTDGSTSAVFPLTTEEFYLGINYLF